MEQKYIQAKDKNVYAYMIYGKTTSDGKAYVDEKCTVQFKTSELQEAFLKRAIIKIGTSYHIPTGFSVASDIGSVSYAATSGSGDQAKTVLSTLAAVKD